jgi:hypothetical protein
MMRRIFPIQPGVRSLTIFLIMICLFRKGPPSLAQLRLLYQGKLNGIATWY